MTGFVTIEPGQWVLAFHQPYGPYDKTLAETLERYAFRHWMETDTADEVFFVAEVTKVMPKTFLVAGSQKFIDEGARLDRSHVVAACKSQEAALALRDRFFVIGEQTAAKIEAEMNRRIKKFADREQERALHKIHACLPHIFGRKA